MSDIRGRVCAPPPTTSSCLLHFFLLRPAPGLCCHAPLPRGVSLTPLHHFTKSSRAACFYAATRLCIHQTSSLVMTHPDDINLFSFYTVDKPAFQQLIIMIHAQHTSHHNHPFCTYTPTCIKNKIPCFVTKPACPLGLPAHYITICTFTRPPHPLHRYGPYDIEYFVVCVFPKILSSSFLLQFPESHNTLRAFFESTVAQQLDRI